MSRTRLFTRPIYLLLILALVLSLAVVAVPAGSRVSAAPSEVWVCPTGDCGHPGAQYDSIQDGIDAVSAPGTVHVAAGTYYTYNIILKNNVQVLGAGAAVTIIDGGGSGPVVLADGVGPDTKLDGFTITNGKAGIELSDCSPVISNCIFSGNSAAAGGGMCNESSSPNVTNCIFSGNSAYSWGGMHNWASSPTVTNCIFSGNWAQVGGGMHNDDYSSPSVTNCIFRDNVGGEIFNDVTSTPVVTYCDIEGVYPGVTNIDADPMFVDPANNDYHSQAGSPCIDAGTNDGAPSEDIDGNLRPIDGNGDGIATTDMGAYEYVPASVEFSATPTTGPIPLEVHFTDQTPGDFDSWSWDFGDGSTSSEQNPTHVYTLPGPFTVSLTSGGGIETKVDYIHPYTQGVGGEAYPVSRLAILAPWIALGMAFIAGSFMALRRRRAQG